METRQIGENAGIVWRKLESKGSLSYEDNLRHTDYLGLGIPFNPLGQAPPDLSQPWMQRRIGGLGIYLVRRKMDDVSYTYVDNSNVLTIEKVILNTIKEE